MWKTSCPIECGDPAICRPAISAEISSTHAMGSACAPLPRSSSVSSRWDIPGSSPPREVLLLQNPAMMQLVTRHQIGQRSRTDLILVRNTPPRPRRAIQITQECQGRPPHRNIVLDQLGQRTLPERTVSNIVILLKTLDRSPVTARDSQGAIRHDPLRVAYVPQHFLRAPLIGRVTKISLTLLPARKQQHHLPALRVQRSQNVGARYQRYIAIVVRRILARIRPRDRRRCGRYFGWFEHALLPCFLKFRARLFTRLRRPYRNSVFDKSSTLRA